MRNSRTLFQLRLPLFTNHSATIARRLEAAPLPGRGEQWNITGELAGEVRDVYPAHQPYAVVELRPMNIAVDPDMRAYFRSLSQAGWFFSPPGMVEPLGRVAIREVPVVQPRRYRFAWDDERTVDFFRTHVDLLLRCDRPGSYKEPEGRELIRLARTTFVYAPTTLSIDIMAALRNQLRKLKRQGERQQMAEDPNARRIRLPASYAPAVADPETLLRVKRDSQLRVR